MSIDFAGDKHRQAFAIDRRQRRLELPDCPSCRRRLHVDVRSSDTLYTRCVWCGYRRMIAKPAADPGL